MNLSKIKSKLQKTRKYINQKDISKAVKKARKEIYKDKITDVDLELKKIRSEWNRNLEK